MSNKNWNNSEYPDQDPWDRGTYQTGYTRPPRGSRGLVALLLVIIIFLCGIVSILTMLNIRIFQEMSSQIPKETAAIDFIDREPAPSSISADIPETTAPAAAVTVPTEKSGGIQIHPSPEPIPNIPQEGGLSYQEIYVKAIDSVVSISCLLDGGSASGTGVVLTADGYIVTNAHVVEGAREITVGLTDGREFSASLIGADSFSDLAVLYIGASGLKPAEFGDSAVLQVGDAVAAIGNPLGTELWGSMTPGIVSGINREITTGGRTMTLIQTNAALNSGNSGGPLLNCYGQVVGINTMKMGDSMSAAGVEGLGFAIPSTTVQQIVNQLMDQGYVSGRPSLGIIGKEVSIFYQMYYRMPQGLYIDEVISGSDAEAVGLRSGDILMRLDGVQITSEESLIQALYSYQVGDTIQAEFYRYRNRTLYTVTLTIEEATS